MSNIRGLYDDKDDDPKDDNRDSNNRYVGGIGSQGGGRSVRCVLYLVGEFDLLYNVSQTLFSIY